jgi:hypothetical protein
MGYSVIHRNLHNVNYKYDPNNETILFIRGTYERYTHIKVQWQMDQTFDRYFL